MTKLTTEGSIAKSQRQSGKSAWKCFHRNHFECATMLRACFHSHSAQVIDQFGPCNYGGPSKEEKKHGLLRHTHKLEKAAVAVDPSTTSGESHNDLVVKVMRDEEVMMCKAKDWLK